MTHNGDFDQNQGQDTSSYQTSNRGYDSEHVLPDALNTPENVIYLRLEGIGEQIEQDRLEAAQREAYQDAA